MELAAIQRYNSIAAELHRLRQSESLGNRGPSISEAFRKKYRFGILECFVRAFGMGFSIGAASRFLYHAFPLLLRGSLNKLVALALKKKDWIRFGVFGGTLLASIRTLMLSTGRMKGPLGYYRGAIVGLVSSLSLLAVPRSSRESISLFVLVRALEIATLKMAARDWIPCWYHADTLLMMLSSAQIIWAWIFHPQSLDRSYLRQGALSLSKKK